MAVEIRAVSEQMEAALKRVPALRRKVIESVTQKVKARLDTEIASRVRDTRQNPRMAGNPHRQQSGVWRNRACQGRQRQGQPRRNHAIPGGRPPHPQA